MGYFKVTAVPDTIGHGDQSTIYIQGKKADSTNYDPPGDTVVLFKLDSAAQNMGRLTGYDSSGVTYGFVKSGGVKYKADGEKPDSLDYAKIAVQQRDDSGIAGEGELVVLKSSIKLKILQPPAKKIHKITAKPKMPVIPCKAKLSGYSGGGNHVVNWECKVRYDYPPGSDEATFTKQIPLDSVYNSEWNLNFDNSAKIIGGKATLKVKTTIAGQLLQDSTIFYIRGENPNPSTVKKGLSNGIEALVETESAGTYHQFGKETYATPNEGLPVNAGKDWGMCQINSDAHTISTELLWDWTANLAKGRAIFTGWARNLANIDFNNMNLPPNTNIPQLVLDCQTYAHYQGGTIAGAYQWIPDSTGTGQWIHNPTNADGDANLVINDNTNYRNNWGN